jgi:hypothetical protein
MMMSYCQAKHRRYAVHGFVFPLDCSGTITGAIPKAGRSNMQPCTCSTHSIGSAAAPTALESTRVLKQQQSAPAAKADLMAINQSDSYDMLVLTTCSCEQTTSRYLEANPAQIHQLLHRADDRRQCSHKSSDCNAADIAAAHSLWYAARVFQSHSKGYSVILIAVQLHVGLQLSVSVMCPVLIGQST